MTETITDHYAVQRHDSLHAGFVDCPYEELAGKSKYYSQGHFRISDCSLIEYIGVEWSSRMPKEEHLPYMTQVFDTLASVGNDSAAWSAFQVLSQVYSHTEFMMRRARLLLLAPNDDWFTMHPFYPNRRLEDVLHEELRHELLEFIRARFWMMPTQIPKDVLEALSWNGKSAAVTHKGCVALVNTRRAMIRACISAPSSRWNGTPGDANDELAFKMLCSMANPWHGGCPAPEKKPEINTNQFRDLVQQELRTVIVDHAENHQRCRGVEFNWKYWLTCDPRPQECGLILETLAKTRAKLGGYRGALLDIAAREKVKAMSHQVP